MGEPETTERNNAPTTAAGEAPKQPSLPPQAAGTAAALGVGEKLLLVTSFVLFAVFFLAQAWAGGTLASWAVIWVLASFALLHSGGLALTESAFGLAMAAGAGLAGLCMFGTFARWVAGRLRRGVERQRVIGPGGRVLRVLHVPSKEPATHPVLSWIPDAATLLLITFVVVRLLEWGGNRWLPDALSCALVLACLYLFCLYAPLWLARLWIGLFRGLFRFARRTGFRAGAVTVALLALVGTTVFSEARSLPTGSSPSVRASGELQRAQTASQIQRELLFDLADTIWPEQAFVSGVRRYLAPLFDAARDPYDAQLGFWHRPDRSVLLAMSDGIVGVEGTRGVKETFDECVQALYPGVTSRAEKRIVSSYHQLKRADGYDIALDVLLRICNNHSENGPYPKLEAAYWLAIGREANKRVDPTRRYRREVGESALGSPGVDCDAGDPGFIERCPSPWDSPEERAATLEELAQIRWQELNRLQCTVILQKAVLGWSDEEIAAAHSGMDTARAKDTYQNARRKIRQKLSGGCSRSPY